MFDHVGDVFKDRARTGAGDNGAPGVLGGRYYCAYLKDFCGHNIEAGIYADE